MKDLVSLRSEVSGVVEFFQIKTNKIKKVLLPGGMIFITNRKRKNGSFGIKFSKPVKYTLKSQLGQVVHLQHGNEVDEGDSLLTIHSEIEGTVAIKKNKITVTKKSIVKEYEFDKNYEVVVENEASVKIGQVLARVVSPIYGIIKYGFVPPESEKDRTRKIDGLEVLQDASAYEIPDDFIIKVSDGAEIAAGAVIAEGVIREDSYSDLSIEKESYEEEKEEEEEETIAEEETEEIEEESKEEFNYDEESIDSEFDSEEEEPAAQEDEEYQQSSFKKKKKSSK